MTELPFDVLIERLRQGDEDAAAELVRQFEPEVRRFVRFRLTSPNIRRLVDSLDVVQSVLAKFFVELNRGVRNVESHDQLRNLLLTMARNKLIDQVRRQQATKRDTRRAEGDAAAALENVVDPANTPSQQVANTELYDALRIRLATDDRHLVDERMNGRSWEDLAAELKSTPEAVRKRMTRAIDRAAQELGVLQ